MIKKQTCPLCFNLSDKIEDDNYYLCSQCKAIFLDNKLYLSQKLEKSRYEEHNNDINDDRYRRFVSPITKAVLKEQSKENIGLDFGAGTGPVISAVLKEHKYNISQYDPFFFNDKKLLEKKYDYIACCEVVEHFNNPYKEFTLLKNLLKPNGSLYLKTYLYNNNIDFKNWRYRKDPTHIFIYQKETFEYIYKKFNFKNLDILDKLIILRN